MAVTAIIAAIVGFWVRDVYTSGLIAAIVIPVCGIMGVRQKNQRCLFMFFTFNGMCAVFYVLALILTLAISIPTLNCLCDPQCRASRWKNDQPSASTVDDVCPQQDALLRAYRISLIIGGVACFLQLLGFFFGRKLARDPYFAVAPVQQRQIAMSPYGLPVGVPVQPMGMPAAAAYGGYAGYTVAAMPGQHALWFPQHQAPQQQLAPPGASTYVSGQPPMVPYGVAVSLDDGQAHVAHAHGPSSAAHGHSAVSTPAPRVG
jgi:hypothetical protein